MLPLVIELRWNVPPVSLLAYTEVTTDDPFMKTGKLRRTVGLPPGGGAAPNQLAASLNEPSDLFQTYVCAAARGAARIAASPRRTAPRGESCMAHHQN